MPHIQVTLNQPLGNRSRDIIVLRKVGSYINSLNNKKNLTQNLENYVVVASYLCHVELMSTLTKISGFWHLSVTLSKVLTMYSNLLITITKTLETINL